MTTSSILRPAKIADTHLSKRAIVYIRQSTLQQTQRHQESTRLQYRLTDRVESWGWAPADIEVIDEDLGQTASSIEGRPGFQRMVTQVTMDEVGLIVGLDVSRLARSCQDWYRLLELCSLFDVLIADTDGVYAPGHYNDRLLLGLKGTMSEAELHLIRQRMLAGKSAKAERGELKFRLPMGYVWSDDEIIKDPDEQAQATIELLFEIFERKRTINGLLQHLSAHGILMPHRRRTKPNRDQLEWRRPNRKTLSNMLHHPIYAGAYVYGRRPTDPKRKIAGRPHTGKVVAGPDECQVLIKHNHPGYIDWETFERNLAQLESNQASVKGTPRSGGSILAGLIKCGRCGYRMVVHYAEASRWRYGCTCELVNYGGQTCQSLTGRPLDELVEHLVLQALEPAALEVSMRVLEATEAEREQLDQLWHKRLERAAYNSQRAFQQYDAVDPQNRLVARQLETRWEEALAEEQQIRLDYQQALETSARPLTDAERREIRALASDIPVLWRHPETSVEERQTIAHTMINQIVVEVRGETEIVDVDVYWAGGDCTSVTIRRPVASWDQLSYYQQLADVARQLFDDGMTYPQIAEELNDRGFFPARKQGFNASSVLSLLRRLGLNRVTKSQVEQHLDLADDEWTITTLAAKLDMPPVTLYGWLRRGEVSARKRVHMGREIWIINAAPNTVEALRKRRTNPQTWSGLMGCSTTSLRAASRFFSAFFSRRFCALRSRSLFCSAVSWRACFFRSWVFSDGSRSEELPNIAR